MRSMGPEQIGGIAVRTQVGRTEARNGGGSPCVINRAIPRPSWLSIPATATLPAAAHAAPPVHPAAGRFDPCAVGSRSTPCRRAGRDRALASPMASPGAWRNLGSMVHLLGHPCPGVPFLFAGVGVEVAGALGAIFPERDHPKQKCRGGRRPTGGVGRGLPPERT